MVGKVERVLEGMGFELVLASNSEVGVLGLEPAHCPMLTKPLKIINTTK